MHMLMYVRPCVCMDKEYASYKAFLYFLPSRTVLMSFYVLNITDPMYAHMYIRTLLYLYNRRALMFCPTTHSQMHKHITSYIRTERILHLAGPSKINYSRMGTEN